MSGTTLYVFKPSKVACGTKCQKIWIPLTLPQGVTSASAGPGVNAAKLGTVAMSNGALQVTYSGKSLWWFYKDKHPGQVTGNITDKWGKWYVDQTVKPSTQLELELGKFERRHGWGVLLMPEPMGEMGSCRRY